MEKEELLKQGRNPIHLICPQCGSAARYDIADRVYHCALCGSDTSPGEQLDKSRQWQKLRQKKLKEDVKLSSTLLYSCPGCGAKVIVREGEALGTCSFCGGSLVRREYMGNDAFPESVIPFRISLEDAREKLKKWNRTKASLKVKRALSKHIDDLEAYYLPYQFVRGPIECSISRDMSERTYRCGSYVDEIVVNASRQLNNEVLDAAEPFDFEECRDFNFGYVADHKVKMQDIDDQELLRRSKEEVTKDCRKPIEKAMHSTGISIYADNGELERLPLLLPMYVIRKPGLDVAVNGQSGKIAVSLNETVDVNRFWFVEPLMTMLILGLIALFWSKDLELGLLTMAVVGCIVFTAFGQDRSSHPMLKVYTSDRSGKGEKQIRPVFREQTEKGTVNAEISFFPLSRIIFYTIGIILFNAMSALLAIFFQWCRDLPISDLHLLYAGLWLVISVPMTFIFWIAFLRRDIFDCPVVKQILPNGKRRRIRDEKGEANIRSFIDFFRKFEIEEFWVGMLLLGLPTLMFVMSVYLIMTG